MTTERELRSIYFDTYRVPSANQPVAFSHFKDGFQACAELKDKEIEQLKARLHEVSTDWQVNQAELTMLRESSQSATYRLDYRSKKIVKDAIFDLEQDVAAWKREVEAKAIEECASKLDYMAGVEVMLLELAQKKRSE